METGELEGIGKSDHSFKTDSAPVFSISRHNMKKHQFHAALLTCKNNKGIKEHQLQK